jgi:hypothetical protein
VSVGLSRKVNYRPTLRMTVPFSRRAVKANALYPSVSLNTRSVRCPNRYPTFGWLWFPRLSTSAVPEHPYASAVSAAPFKWATGKRISIWGPPNCWIAGIAWIV